MDRWSGRVAVVTGASSGIGAAICRKLVAAGMVVIGAARGVEKIEALSKELKCQPGSLVAVKCDVSKDADIEHLFSFIKKEHKGVDVCINCAGMSRNHTLLEGNPTEWREMMDINVIALCHFTKESVKSMQERRVDDGHVIHVSSYFGHIVGTFPSAHFYAATKHAVRALTDGLQKELTNLKSKIRISAISPGFVETEFVQRMSQSEEAKAMYKMVPCLQANDVAASVCHILGAPPHVQIQDLIIRPTGESL